MEPNYPFDAGEFLSLFPGRRDCYISHDGETFRSAKSALDEHVVRAHLDGAIRVGVYCNHGPDGALTGFGCIDIDFDVPEFVRTVSAIAQLHGLSLWIERSRSKGWHLWLFLSQPMQARDVRRALQFVKSQAIAQSNDFMASNHPGLEVDPKVEIFPKQANLPDGGFGNGVLLPMHGESLKEVRTAFYRIADDAGASLVVVEDWRPALVVPVDAQLVVDLALAAGAEDRSDREAVQRPADSNREGATSEAGFEISKGTRNKTLFRMARDLASRLGLSEAEIRTVLGVVNNGRCRPPLDTSEVGEIARNAASGRYGQENRRDGGLEDSRPIEFLDFEKIAAEGIPQRDWLYEGWLELGDIAVLGGPAGSGKTTAVAALAVSIASGVDWCGLRPRKTGTVLVIDEEQGVAETARLYRRSGAPVPNLFVASQQGVNLFTSDGRERLRQLVKEKRPVLVVLDSFTQTFRGIDENDARDVAEAFAFLFELRDRFGTTIILVHHVKKPPSQGKLDPLNSIRGSTVLGTQASTIWIASPAGTASLDLVQVKRRGGEKLSIRIHYTTEPGDFGRIALSGEPTPESDSEVERGCSLALGYLAQQGRAKKRDIVKLFMRPGVSASAATQAATRALSRLAQRGQVESPSRGCWQLAQNSDPDEEAEG